MSDRPHPELLLLTSLDAEHPLARSLASQLLEHGIYFEGLCEQQFPQVLPVTLDGYRAIAIDDVLINTLSTDEKQKLQAVAGERIVSCLPVADLLDLHRIGPMAKRIYDLHTSGHVLQIIMQAGLTCHHPQVAQIQDARPIAGTAEQVRDGVMAYLTGSSGWHRGWHEHTLHYWKAATGLLGRAEDRQLHDALCASIRATSKVMPVGLHQDELAGLFGTLWLWEQTGESGPMQQARACLDAVLTRRPRLDGLASASGFTDDPLLLHVEQAGGQRYAGFTARRQIIMAEMLHMMAPTLAAMSRGTGDPGYLDEALRLLDYVQKVHFDENDLICQCSRQGVRITPNWSRGMGHALQGVSYLLEDIPADHPARPQLQAFLQRAARGLSRVQDPRTGLWRNVLDHVDARLESSGTFKFVSIYARALEAGWVEDCGISQMVRQGLQGLKRLVWRGGLAASCRGTALGDTAYYLGRPQGWTASPGLGSLLAEARQSLQVVV